MGNVCARSSPDDPYVKEVRRRLIVEWWNRLRIDGHPGETTWEVLDCLERQVSECLRRTPPDISKAESLTAQAALLIDGRCSD